MEIKDALRILNPVSPDLAALKRCYREMSKKYHPDINPNGAEFMKLINAAYECLKANIGKWGKSEQNHAKTQSCTLEDVQEIFNQIKHLPGLLFEVCGTWLWVTGDTYTHRAALKAAKMRFSKGKQAWYWHNGDYVRKTKKRFSLDEIRRMHGSQELEGDSRRAIHA